MGNDDDAGLERSWTDGAASRIGRGLSRLSWNRLEPLIGFSSSLLDYITLRRALDWLFVRTCLTTDRTQGKVHGSLARAGKVKGQTPKVEKQEKKKQPRGGKTSRLRYQGHVSDRLSDSGRNLPRDLKPDIRTPLPSFLHFPRLFLPRFATSTSSDRPREETDPVQPPLRQRCCRSFRQEEDEPGSHGVYALRGGVTRREWQFLRVVPFGTSLLLLSFSWRFSRSPCDDSKGCGCQVGNA